MPKMESPMPGKLTVVTEAVPLHIRLCSDGAVEVDRVAIAPEASLQDALARIARLHPALDVELFADNPCDYEGIGKIIYTAQQAGLHGGAFTFTTGARTLTET
jgi:biopolymer transport protein ExbD